MAINFEEVLAKASADLAQVNDINSLQQTKANYLGKKGIVASMMGNMKDLSIEERKEIGMQSNKIKVALEELFDNKRKEIEEAIINKKL